MSMNILVASATGKTGLHLVQELIDLGQKPTALVRESSDTSALPEGVDAPSYAAPVEIGAVMVGGTVAQVVSSDVAGFVAGDWVQAFGGWQDYALSDGTGVINMGKSPENPSWALGVLGMPGLTAWAGLTQIGQPQSGETLVVAGASGPV